MSFYDILHRIVYWLILLLAKTVFYVFYRDYGPFHRENFPKGKESILFVAAPHGNFLMDAISMFVTCPRNVYFLSATSNFNYPIFGTLVKLLDAIPITRPQDAKRVNGDVLVKVSEDGSIVEGENLGKTLRVGDNLYMEFEDPDDKDLLKEASGTVEEILDEHRVRVKWLTKGKRKGKSKRLVGYGSVVMRVEKGNKTPDDSGLIPKSMSKGIDRSSTSPGRIPFPIPHHGSPDSIFNSPPNWLLANERTPLIASDSSSKPPHTRQPSNRTPPPSPNTFRIPNAPTTFSYTRLPPHSEVYSAVHNTLARSRSIVIFPEGGSRDYYHMTTLKHGTSVMALSYLSSSEPDAFGNKRTIKIVPCGVNFFNRHRFRSRVFVDIGPTIEVPESLIELYKQGGSDKRQASQELTKIIHAALSELTVNVPDYDTLLFLKTASRLYRDKLPTDLNFSDKLILLRRIARKYLSTTPATDEARRLKREIVMYAQTLRSKRLSPPHISTTSLSLFFYLPLFILLCVITGPGLLLFSPIGIIAGYVARKQGENEMLHDDNSLAVTRWPGRDVVATWKMLVGAGLFVVFDIAYSVLTVHFMREFGLWHFHHTREVIFAGLFCFLIVWPVIAYGTILLWERMCWVGKRVWVGVWGIAKPRQRRDLLVWREQLSVKVVKWVDGTGVAP